MKQNAPKKQPIRKIEVYVPRDVYKAFEKLAENQKMSVTALAQHIFGIGLQYGVVDKKESEDAKSEQ